MQRYNIPRAGAAFKGPAMPRLKAVACGDVLWLKVPQMLSAANQLAETSFKKRPFLVLQKATMRVDENDNCIDNTHLLGVTATSQEFLVEGRPHVRFDIPHQHKHTYAYLDSLCNLPANGEQIKIAYTFKREQRQELSDGLNTVLQPEKRFFLKRIFNKCMPGEVWRVQIATGDAHNPLQEADALVMLRRGKFFKSPSEESGDTRFTPYMVAVLPGNFNAQDLRGMRWDDVRLVPLHDRSLKAKVGELTDETVSILLNTLRQRVGVQPIVYERPLVRHIFTWFNPIRLFMAGPGGL